MHHRISCPSCSMNASTSDHRHFSPAGMADGAELRRCRNCGEVITIDRCDHADEHEAAFSQAS